MCLRGIIGTRGAVTAVEFDEMVDGAAVSGLALGVRLGSDREAAAYFDKILKGCATGSPAPVMTMGIVRVAFFVPEGR